jgi:short-subunit dehydrogenase
MKSNETALITGASSGIGLHLAREFARHGHPLILVAPVEEEIRAVADELHQSYGVRTRAIARNLEEPNAAQEIFDALQRDQLAVDILVNNAGHGFKGPFSEIPIERDLSMVRLNIEAVLRLTKLFLPPMLQRRTGRILNTASVAGFEPGPLLAVYHGTKAFVLSVSEALATELEEFGITVTALCPGPTDTDFFPKADMLETRAFQKANVMAPQEVARMGYTAVMQGQRVIVTGAVNKAMVFSRHLMPESAQAKVNLKLYEDVPPEERTRSRGQIERKAEAEQAASH